MVTLLSQIKGCIAFLGYVVNTIFWAIPIILGSVIKLIPFAPLRTATSYVLDFCASAWISVNGVIERLLHPVKIELTGDTQFSTKEWYMVIANHQSWVDILILQRIFNHKIPFLKFFLKQELIFVPILGLAWWALDFPFMRRYSTAQLKKNPKLRGKDIEITRKACAKFKAKPVSVMNFVEGTRFHKTKHKKQNSQFQHLLKPKAGGMAFALSAMGDQIHRLVDVAIYYPDHVPSYWDYLTGKLPSVKVHIKISDIDPAMRGDYMNDRNFKIGFQEQLNQLWLTKDSVISQLAGQVNKE
ncbi:acyltransferase [Shewanella sp. CG12_big_fil_rev_8_21_14_0_65_47_15]|uniref:acyltransferase n=1 Tax=Shewanella sp. CG12_big_fil_rev_8_21_14_0_65_47_15 TaxID=1975537 RepID=UPI000CC6B722|nr:acyltransferase [Shewanella sp. CG12_big_fil_rev_8_21_14_0_65_47_15]PIW61653.1 MAG: acyltransferase [Shewanella sp. CG12_big_fil_rev_8_21_14_0_65_47_15]